MHKKKYKGLSTTAMHTAQKNNALQSHLTPIYATSTFTYNNTEQGIKLFTGEEEGYIYSRWGNPTIEVAEKTLAALETFNLTNKEGLPLEAKAILHASGMAALTTLMMANLQQGDIVLTHQSLYGGMQELLEKVLPPLGIQTIIVDLTNTENATLALKNNKNIKFLYLETPANPTLKCVDIEILTKIAHEHNLKVAVDNTFATPYLQQPFKFGVDFVFHSTTKFLNGHGTIINGVLIGTDLEFMKTKVTKWHRLLGGNSNAFDAFLLTNGLKTLELRMEKHCSNAMTIANYLNDHDKISEVHYLGIRTNKGFELAKKQMKHPGALMSFELKDGFDGAVKFIDALEICTRAVSLGTIDTLVSHPASTTHYGVAKEKRLSYGITEGLIRMSVGIENIEDLLEDIEQALEKV